MSIFTKTSFSKVSNSATYPHAACILVIFSINCGYWFIANDLYNLIKEGLAKSLVSEFILIFTSTKEFIGRKRVVNLPPFNYSFQLLLRHVSIILSMFLADVEIIVSLIFFSNLFPILLPEEEEYCLSTREILLRVPICRLEEV